jgi:hypothetical protein
MNTPPGPPQGPAPDEEPIVFTPKLVLACVLGVLAVGVLSSAVLAGVQDVASPSAAATPSVAQLTQLLQRVTYKPPEPTPDVTQSPHTPVVGIFPTPGDASGSAATPSATGTPSLLSGVPPTVVPTIDLGPRGQSTPAGSPSGPSLIVTPVPSNSSTAPTPASAPIVIPTPASSAPSVPTVRPAATP